MSAKRARRYNAAPAQAARKLGQGGMGAVYLGHDESLDRQLAEVQRATYASDNLCKPV